MSASLEVSLLASLAWNTIFSTFFTFVGEPERPKLWSSPPIFAAPHSVICMGPLTVLSSVRVRADLYFMRNFAFLGRHGAAVACTVTSRGSGALTTSMPRSSLLLITILLSLISRICSAYVTCGIFSFSATCGPTWAVSPSMA